MFFQKNPITNAIAPNKSNPTTGDYGKRLQITTK